MPKRKSADRKKSDKKRTQYWQRARSRNTMQAAPTYDGYKKEQGRLNLILGRT